MDTEDFLVQSVHGANLSLLPQEVFPIKESFHVVSNFLLHHCQVKPSPCPPQSSPEIKTVQGKTIKTFFKDVFGKIASGNHCILNARQVSGTCGYVSGLWTQLLN